MSSSLFIPSIGVVDPLIFISIFGVRHIGKTTGFDIQKKTALRAVLIT
jgi:hypothetical protein